MDGQEASPMGDKEGMQINDGRHFEVLINPSASSGRGMRVWKKVKKELDARGVPYRKHILKAPSEATLLVRDLTKNLLKDCHLLVLGGDGTLNEVLNGIEDFQHTVLSCLRTGSGNDFAANVGIDKNLMIALDQLLNHPMEASLDYGVVRADEHEPRRFLISCGMGYDADICEEVSKSRLKKVMNRFGLGKLVYLMIGLKQIFTRSSTDAVLYLDGKKAVHVPKLFSWWACSIPARVAACHFARMQIPVTECSIFAWHVTCRKVRRC